MSEPLLVAQALCKRFGEVVASDELSISVMPGEIHALIGPNGAGKSTALGQLAGEIVPDSGKILFAGKDISNTPMDARARRGLSRSFQITSLFENFTVHDNLALAVQAHAGHSFHFWRNAAKEVDIRGPAEGLADQFGLSDRLNEPVSHLAHGEKRQLEVAMSMAGKPRMLLLDEPMAGIGPGGSLKLTELLEGLRGKVSILLVEHDMDVIFSLADRISVLVYGRCIACDMPEAIRGNEDVRKAYLGSEA